MDGTGFGYGQKRELRFKRGSEIRKVSSHVKVELIAAKEKGRKETFILSVNMGKAYSDERKLLMDILRERRIKADLVLADALYGMSNEVLEKFFDMGRLVVVAVKDSLHTKVSSPIRKRAKKLYEEHRELYKERGMVERLIGKIKNAYGAIERARRFDMAVRYIWAKMILYNWAILFLAIFSLSGISGVVKSQVFWLIFFEHTHGFRVCSKRD